MIPAEEPQPWPWRIRAMWFAIGIIATPFILVADIVNCLKRKI